MSTPPFEGFLELWQDVLSPTLQQWHAMTDEEKRTWEENCPPHYRNGLTFFLLHHLYGASAEDPPPSL